MNHGIVEVAAYQETLLMISVFGIAILATIWIGFRRWLQYNEQIGRLVAELAAERAQRYGSQMERVEERLKAIEQLVTDGALELAGQIDSVPSNPLPESTKPDEV